MLAIYTPLLCELDDTRASLNLSEFVLASNVLFDELSIHERNVLVTFCKNCDNHAKLLHKRTQSATHFSFKV